MAVTLAVTLVALALVMQLWRATPHVPFTMDGDAGFIELTVQNVIDTGWYQRAPRLGAPFGASLHDFPQGGDNLQFLMIRGLTQFSSDAGAVTNAYFLLTFLLVATAGVLVLRWLGLSHPAAAVMAVLYTFLPYHFFRGEHHLLLSGYYAVPLGIALAVAATRGDALLTRRPERRGPAAFATRRTFATLSLAAVIGSSGSYYVAFTVTLLGAAGALHALRGRSLRPAAPAAVAAAAIIGVLGLNLLPNVAHRVAHGVNDRVAQRDPAETERYGLKLSAMLLPDPGHRVAPLAALGTRYQGTSDVPSEGGQSLGMLGGLGLLWLLAVGLTSVAGGRALPGDAPGHRLLAFLAMATLVIGTVGGLSVLVAFFLTPQFRSWNRVSIVLGFLSLAAVGLLLDRWRATCRRCHSLAGPAGLVLLLVFGVLDQTGSGAVPAYEPARVQHDSDRAFVAEIERQLPKGAMVYQLPYVPFPESAAIGGTGSYGQVRGYLHSQHLRWSWGAMRGRDHGWQDALLGQPVDLTLHRLAAVGFAGLWIDRHGYADGARSLERDLADRLGAAPLVSSDGHLSFFSLVDFTASSRQDHPAAAVETLAAQTLTPLEVRSGQGARRHREDGQSHWLDGAATATLLVTNPDRSTRTAVVDTRIETAGPGAITIIWPNGSEEEVTVTAGETLLRRRITVPTGTHAIRFHAATPPFPRRHADADLRFRLLQPAIYDAPPPGY